ncbi:MAG: protein kinase [Pirellulales bacterium]|nr:protein kinase [Pirellulales bacterium]
MSQATAEQFGQRALDLGLLTDRQLQEVWSALGSRSHSGKELLPLLIQTLLRKEYLTNYQVECLTRGDKTGYFYDKYKVLYQVGSGTFARVYRAVHTTTGEVRALKVLRRRYSQQPEFFNRFDREGRVGIKLRHPNIVRVDDVISHGNVHYMVMEFIEGQNLRDFVKIRKKLIPLEATRLMVDITDGMRCAFENGLTHRDMKMSNILVSSRGQAKIVDFGLAGMDESLPEAEQDGMLNARSIDYAALERITGVRKDDTRSDIYFLGCMYYNMLAGVPPLTETKDRLQRLSRQRFVDVPPILKLEPALAHCVSMVINKAMSLDPEKRYQSPGAMLVDLESASRRLQELAQATGGGPSPDDTQVETVDSPPRSSAQAMLGRTVLVVESNGQMQEIFRSGFKNAGYRVLLISDPARAVNRLFQDNIPPDCVLINAQSIGEPALDAFNELGANKKTSSVPTVLLLGEDQKAWKKQVKAAGIRRVLSMPLTMKQLREALAEIVFSTAGERE